MPILTTAGNKEAVDSTDKQDGYTFIPVVTASACEAVKQNRYALIPLATSSPVDGALVPCSAHSYASPQGLRSLGSNGVDYIFLEHIRLRSSVWVNRHLY